MTPQQYGDWAKLTEYLRDKGNAVIRLSDDEMQEITGSIDVSKPYEINFAIPKYSIQRRANDAGYDVTYQDKTDKSTKVFKKKQ